MVRMNRSSIQLFLADTLNSPTWTSHKFASSVQSVAFAPEPSDRTGSLWLAVGLEDGTIHVLQLHTTVEAGQFYISRCQKLWEAPLHQQHCAAVRRLSWQASSQDSMSLLASAGDDHAVHVYEVESLNSMT